MCLRPGAGSRSAQGGNQELGRERFRQYWRTASTSGKSPASRAIRSPPSQSPAATNWPTRSPSVCASVTVRACASRRASASRLAEFTWRQSSQRPRVSRREAGAWAAAATGSRAIKMPRSRIMVFFYTTSPERPVNEAGNAWLRIRPAVGINANIQYGLAVAK